MIFRQEILSQLPFLIAALIPALTFHEWSHAAVAYLHGDRTAQRAGRLSLNPFVHLDIMGTLAIFLIGFGWAKPVPVNPGEMRGKWAEFLVAAAGPATNLVLGILFALFLRFGLHKSLGSGEEFLRNLFQVSMILNFALCFFNLLPIGPLDGSTLLAKLLPYDRSLSFQIWNERFGAFVLLGLILADMILPIHILRTLIWLPSLGISQLILS